MQKDQIVRIFTKIPTLTTERLTLRRLKPSDYRDMFEYACRPEVTKYLLWEPHNSSQRTYDYLAYLQTLYRKRDFYDWAVVTNDEKKMIGTCGFTTLDFSHNAAEVGYVLNPRYWGRGIATEAVRRVLDFAFRELNVRRVEAKYIIGNDASRRVMEKCGFTYEGTLRRAYRMYDNNLREVRCYSMLREEYENLYLE